MSMEKHGVISENDTPHCGDGSGDGSGCKGEPQTKEGADRMASHLATDLTDAVANQSKKHQH